jgi:succinate-semialdehyde dehydrogenase/glutarate-semialdehyde dehydrogenase
MPVADYPDTQLFIDGRWRPALAGETIAVENPATSQVIGQVAHARQADLDLALAAADKGFQIWRSTPPIERAKVLRRAADLLRERADAIGTLLSMEQGKPLVQGKFEPNAASEVLDWFAGESQRLYGRLVAARIPGVTQAVIREPVGPVAAFTPWNFPVNQVVRKVGAALASGCSIILKAPEETPASPAAFVQAFIDAGLPDGVLNLVYGTPAEISSYLIPHPVIRKITFTGSTAVGKQLAALAGLHMKRTTMELGGHAPAIVCADADVESAATTLAFWKYRNAGQVCVAPTRLLVERPAMNRFVDAFKGAAETLKLGDGLDPDTTMGPLAQARRVDAIEEFVRDAVGKGADLVTGGSRQGNVGHFYKPTVLANVPITARAMNEEPFGPVALIAPFDNLDDALAEANRLPYGLAAYAFTRSDGAAARISECVESGMISLNHVSIGLPETPFGGMKDSGYGSEGGLEGTEAYLSTKFISRLAV